MADFTWSYSALKQYENCPRQYNEIRVLKNYVVKENEAMRYGTEVHKALEDYVAEGKPLAKNYQRFKSMVDPLVDIPGIKYPEHEMALTYDKLPCDFGSEHRWVRGIADLLIVDGDYAFIVDYKTGSNKYPDPKQLRLMALMVFTHFPEVNKIKGGLFRVSYTSICLSTAMPDILLGNKRIYMYMCVCVCIKLTIYACNHTDWPTCVYQSWASPQVFFGIFNPVAL